MLESFAVFEGISKVDIYNNLYETHGFMIIRAPYQIEIMVM